MTDKIVALVGGSIYAAAVCDHHGHDPRLQGACPADAMTGRKKLL